MKHQGSNGRARPPGAPDGSASRLYQRETDEFAPGAREWPENISRREFLRLSGATLALAGLGACTKQPLEKIVPYVDQPEIVIPGKPLRFATATQYGGFGQGLLVTSYEGRPTKIEGNPSHPASLGATTIWGQADVLDLYDPDRAQTVTTGGAIRTLDDFWNALNVALRFAQTTGGAGMRILTEPVSSPTLLAQLADVVKRVPASRWCIWDPLNRDNLNGKELLFDFSKARIVVGLDSDFLYAHPNALRHARDLSNARRVITPDGARMNRFYAAEPTPTITGSNADHRIAVAARDILPLAQNLAAYVGIGTAPGQMENKEWVEAVVADLNANRGASIVIAGEMQPPEVHDLVSQINTALGNDGVTISPTSPLLLPPNRIDLRQLVDQMRRGEVELLIVLGGNPCYDAPADFDFASAFEKVKLRVHHSVHFNETSRHSHWHVPAFHFLESWSDTRAFDGSTSIVQPLIQPMYSGTSPHEILEGLTGRSPRSSYEIIRSGWQAQNQAADFDAKWRRTLSDGIVSELSAPGVNSAFRTEEVQRPTPNSQRPTSNMEVVFRADVSVRDGRYANNGWLQELPRQFSKLVWDNAALISPQLAQREGLENGDVINLTFRARTLRVPVWIQPGQAENSVTLPLGYGREVAGRLGRNVGFNAYVLRTSDALWFGDGLTIGKTGDKHPLVSTQHHHSIDGDRGILHDGTFDQFTAEPGFAQKAEQLPPLEGTLYQPDEFPYKGYKWGMVVDLNVCIGCHACTIACQAENNIPVVGKEQVAVDREMHWIRVDTYYSGSAGQPAFTHQPVPCMHCEMAPCELVCPVGATVHDNEGLNLQVYNRCVGTRYCSNNCPYKVRRFNFLEYNNGLSPSQKLVKNPDVTVRSRGVMEKCTYCIQRINAARIDSEVAQRKIRDGEIVPACAQVCPVEAITFGNINDPQSRVALLKRSPLNYWMLGQLNTQPRTSYFAKLRNRNPQLKTS